MKRTRWIVLALLVTLALLLAQCGPTEAPPEPTEPPPAEPTKAAPATEAPAPEEPAEEVTLTWGFWGSPEEKATHEKVADAFMAENPNIKVELWHQPWGDYFTKLQTLWAANDSESIPDVLFLFPVPSYAADGVLENLDPFISASGYDLADYWPGVIDTTSFEGSVYGFPRDVGLNVLYYNKDHFDEAGLSYPDETWSWDDFQAAAEALTIIESSGRVSRYGLGMEGGKYWSWLLSNGGTILDDMFVPSRCGLADAESVEAITYFAELMNSEFAMRDANLNQAGGDSAVFQGEQVSMIIQNASRVPAFNAAGMNYDVAPLPVAPGGVRVAAGGGAAWTMSSHSDTKDEAWQFLQYLQSAEGGQKVYIGTGEIMPPTRSAAESDAFMSSGQPPENRQAFITQAEHTTPEFNGWFAEWNELSGTLLNPVLAEIWAGTADPAEVLPQLCADVDAYLADAGYEAGAEPAPAEPTEEAAITWGFWGSPEEKATHEKVADAFMAENPNIKVELWHQPWGDYFTKLQTLWAANDSESIPDVLFLFPVPSYAADGVLENLDPFISASGYDLDDYWPGVVDTTSFEGSVYGFPRDVGLNVLYYNKDHFDEAGLSYPDETWSWDDFQAAAEALTIIESSGRVSRYGLGMEGGKYFTWLLSNGGTIMDDMFNPSRCGLADAESIEAITYFSDLMNSEFAMRDANLNQAGGDSAVFQGEQVSMIIQNASRVPAFNAAGMNYDVAPLPVAPGGVRAAAGSGAAWTMSSHSDSKDAAWQFLQYLQSAEGGQKVYIGTGEIMPPTRSAAESDAFMASGQPPENRQAFITQAEHTTPEFNGWFAEWNEINGTLLTPVLAEIWAGTADPAEVLPQLCEDVDGFLADAGYPK